MEKDKIQTILESHNVPLTDQKKSDLWYAIETDIQKLPIPSPFLFSFITKKSMASIIIALVLMLGASGSVYASNEARPGDILFPIDQAIERVRLSLTNDDETRARLQVTFEEERLTEQRSILAERSDDNDDEDGTNNTSTSTNSFEAEADVFLNTTIVKVEINDRKTTFETSADTREEVIAEIVSRFGIDRATVDTALDFEIEDRDSQDDSVSDSNDNEDDSNDDQSSNDDSDDNAKIEVRVEDGVAEVRMEYNGKVDEFESSYTTRATLIVQLALRSGLTQSVISDNLDLEVKD